MLTETYKQLSKKQEEIVDYTGDELLIRGIAGSGKTLVILERAARVAEKYPAETVAIITFNSTLQNSYQYQIEKLGFNNIYVKTFHKWAMSSFNKITGSKYLIQKNTKDCLKRALKQCAEYHTHRFLNEETYLEFLQEEITWIKGQGIFTLEDYIKAKRTGRGSSVRVTEEDKRVIYDIYETYQNEKGYKYDFDDFGLILAKKTTVFPESVKFDHILLDEAQDLDKTQLLSLRAAARKSFVVAADKGQKIYKKSFAWKDIGLNITGGRTKVLSDSFRSTKQIIELASSLQKNDSIIKDEEFIQSNLPEREGSIPMIYNCDSEDNVLNFVSGIAKEYSRSNSDLTIGLIAPNWYQLEKIGTKLRKDSQYFEMIRKDSGNILEPGIKLTTMHSAKGLEFDIVIVYGFEDWGNKLVENENSTEYWDLQRRLLYVSMTRAKEVLNIVYYGNETPKIIGELGSGLFQLEKI